MHEHHGPRAVEVAPDDNVVAALFDRALAEPARPLFARREGPRFGVVAAADAVREVRRLAAGLVALGVPRGARVAIFSSTRLEFALLDYAAWAAGTTPVPVYESDSAEQLEWILSSSGAEVLFCETAELRARFAGVAPRVPHVRHVFTVDDGDLATFASDDLEDHEEVARRTAAISHDDVATIVYTSGTTGRPKGCVLTHGNLIWEVRQVLELLPGVFEVEHASTLMFLPLAHVLARLVMVAGVSGGLLVGFASGLAHLGEEMRLFSPTVLVVVPRALDKVLAAVRDEAGHGVRRRLVERALGVAEEWSRRDLAGRPVPRVLAVERALYDRLVYRRVRAGVGGRLRWCVSGGAALPEQLAHLFRGMGIEVLEGYGLTETTGAATVNRPGHPRPGTVGAPIPGVAARVGDDGELQLHGGLVFQGYLGDPEGTAAVLGPDGWLRTGDLASIDADGSVRITGRLKEVIVTAGGKNVAPNLLEERIARDPLVSQAVVVGDGRPFVGALLALDPVGVAAWAEQHGRGGRPLAELAADPELHTALQLVVDRANAAVSRAESVREFRLLPRELTIEDGEITPTLKVKRSVVVERYADLIDDLYGAR